MRGRKPKPVAAKKLARNPGRRKLPNQPPKPPADDRPTPPAHLDDGAKAEWARVAELLAPAGLLLQHDRAALGAYCQAYSRWAAAELALREHGAIVKSPSGYPIQNPHLAIANTAMAQMQRLMAEFGLTPSSRARLDIGKPEEDDDSEFFR